MHAPVRRMVLGTLMVASLVGVYFYGQHQGATLTVPINTEADALRARVVDLETRAEVDRQALNELREELAVSRGTIDELERELAFYRDVMAPEEVSRGVILREPTFRPGTESGQWLYRLIAQQGGRDRSVHKGELFVTLWGQVAGQPMSVALTEVDEELSADALGLSFRYFQRFEGTLQLPPGFEPERVTLQAVISKPKADSFENSYAWHDIVTGDDRTPDQLDLELTE